MQNPLEGKAGLVTPVMLESSTIAPSFVSKYIFRAYDIRGKINLEITPAILYEMGLAFGSMLSKYNDRCLYLGRDARLSSIALHKAFYQGALRSGCHVIDLGALPTPVLYYAVETGYTPHGVMITGSHNPLEYNGIKMVVNKKSLTSETIQELYETIRLKRYSYGYATYHKEDFLTSYQKRLMEEFSFSKPIKIIIDDSHGITSLITPYIFSAFPFQVRYLNHNVDGCFPSHLPDPSHAHHFEPLIHALNEYQMELGLMFDGDGDRLGIVTAEGQVVWADRQLMLFSEDILQKNPHRSVVFDVKCTASLSTFIKSKGGIPLMSRTGHSYIKEIMRKENAILGGEMSGHLFFADQWYGFDDGIYAALRLLKLLEEKNTDLQSLLQAYPQSLSSPEYLMPVSDQEKFEVMKKLEAMGDAFGGTVINIDGLRVEYRNGWGLVRPSNTMPALSLRFEACDKKTLDQIKAKFKQILRKVIIQAKFPF